MRQYRLQYDHEQDPPYLSSNVRLKCREVFRQERTIHGNASYDILSQMLLHKASVSRPMGYLVDAFSYRDFQDQLVPAIVGLEGVKDGR